VCNSSNNDSRIALLTSLMLIFLGAKMLHKIHGISRVALVIRIDGSN
jgi:hypothetical protein